jgi:hypothetical protein
VLALSLAGSHAPKVLTEGSHTISKSRVSTIGEENLRVFDSRLARLRVVKGACI